VVSGVEQAAAAEAGAGGELLGAFNVATFAGEVRAECRARAVHA
jgi:hypothetical protein